MDDATYPTFDELQNGGGDGAALLADPSLDSLFLQAERIGQPSAWWRHIPFAHWITAIAAPRLLVELGTHTGVSYAAFCTAVRANNLSTRCWAVDSWRGDEHSGTYGEEIYEELRAYHDARFAEFSGLLRCTFDEAAPHFDDGSIDLLHIDGLHTYDAVRHDFEKWQPKLSDRAVVLFHDTNVLDRNFGVWRLWSELRGKYPSFEFLHGHGLGVLGVGTQLPPAVARFLRHGNAPTLGRVRARFAWLGERWLAETRERLAAGEAAARLATVEARAADGERHAAEAEVLRADAERRLAEAERRATEIEGRLAEAERRATEIEGRAIRAEAMRARAAGRASAARAELATATARAEGELQAALGRAHAEIAARAELVAAMARAEGELQAALGRAHAEIAVRAEAEAAARVESDALRATYLALTNSTAWRVTHPFRRVGERLPPSFRRAVRGTAKLVWWSATLQLPRKLRERRAALQLAATIPAAPEPAPVPVAGEIATPGGDHATARAVGVASLGPALSTFAADAALQEPVSPEPVAPVRSPAVRSSPAPDAVARLVYVSGEPDTPGHLYRVERPAAAARAAGAETVVMPLDEVGTNLDAISNADALVFWRTPFGPGIAAAVERARASGAKVVFDIDDLMVDPGLARTEIIDGIRSQHLTEEAVAEHYGRIRETMLAADLCTASTEELAQHMREAWRPALVLPNGFDGHTLAASRVAIRRWARQRDGLLRIGYAGGSRTHQRDFAICAPAVAETLRRFPEARLVAFRSADGQASILDIEEFPELRGLEDRIEWRNLVPLERLPAEMARFDINLAPLEISNPFCEAKSELKYFEAALVDVPTIASPSGPYHRSIRDGETGMLAASPEQWTDALLRLAGDPGLRRRLATAARRDVLWTYGPEHRAVVMADFVDLLRGGARGARAFERVARRTTSPNRCRAPQVPAHKVVFERGSLASARATVIVPLYNYGSYLPEALDSVVAQTTRPLDLIVVDDASTDDSLAVAVRWAEANASFLDRVLVVRNLANAGLAHTRNVGFDLADTPWVLPLDADNRLRPRCVEECLRIAEVTGATYAYPVIQQFGEGEALMGAAPYDPVRLTIGNYIDAMALVSRAAWAAVGGYRLITGGWEDYDLWCSFAECGLRGEQVPGEPLAEYRVHRTSMIRTAAASAAQIEGMIDSVTRQHPWLTVVWPLGVPRPGTEPPRATPAVHGAGSGGD
jgi:glycosyltransferase involved in cell wall biosynthesis